METIEVSFEQVLQLAQRLSAKEQVRLMAKLAPSADLALQATNEITATPRRSLRGILAEFGTAPSAEDIDEARKEMWGNFPRDDF